MVVVVVVSVEVDIVVESVVVVHKLQANGQLYSWPEGHPIIWHSMASVAIEQSTFSQNTPENPFGASHSQLHKAALNI